MANRDASVTFPQVTEAFPFLAPLNAIPGVKAGWIERVPGLAIHGGRDEAMKTLRPHHDAALREFAGPEADCWRAEQVHGNRVAIVPGPATTTAPDGLPVVPQVDGLITATPGTALAIYVADCGPIWLADARSGAIALLHSGKKGTEGDILGVAVQTMRETFGTRPEDLTAVLGPCIRPPHYETDLPTAIARQADRAGLGNFIDCGLDTASNSARFYSYRKELGTTGRMMAIILRQPTP